jgi:hypothetical protein
MLFHRRSVVPSSQFHSASLGGVRSAALSPAASYVSLQYSSCEPSHTMACFDDRASTVQRVQVTTSAIQCSPFIQTLVRVGSPRIVWFLLSSRVWTSCNSLLTACNCQSLQLNLPWCQVIVTERVTYHESMRWIVQFLSNDPCIQEQSGSIDVRDCCTPLKSADELWSGWFVRRCY